MRRAIGGLSTSFERLAHWFTVCAGSSWAFIFAMGLTLLWLVSGPVFGFSDTWQLVMNTVSSIVTFLMVFLIQRSQNKDTLAIHVKLDELVAAQKGASNRLIGAEDLSEQDVRDLHERFKHLKEQVGKDEAVTAPLSVEDVQRVPDQRTKE